MAVSDVLVVAVAGNEPVVVDASDPALVGQIVIDYTVTNPSSVEFAVDVKTGTLVVVDA